MLFSIVKNASLNSLYEAILEAGPQLLIQMHIVLCTGEISNIQAVSMCSSLLTLTLAASRGFFVQRPRKFADPEPSPQMIFWVFLPMLVLVLSSVINWSVVGLVKEYIALIITCCVTATWFGLWLAEKWGRPEETKNEQEEVEMKGENKKMATPIPNENDTKPSASKEAPRKVAKLPSTSEEGGSQTMTMRGHGYGHGYVLFFKVVGRRWRATMTIPSSRHGCAHHLL